MNVETSGVQQSVMSSTSQSSSSIGHDSMSTVFDNFFPIADHISQIAHLPNILVSLFHFWLLFQMIAVAFWVPMNPNNSDSRFTSDMSYITAAAFCYFKTDSDMCWLIPFLVYAILFLISLGILVYELMYYKSNRKFITWTLYPARFFLELAPLAVLHPIAALFGILIYDYDGNNQIQIIAIVFSAIFYIYFAVLMSYTTGFLSGSAFLENHALATFDVDVYRVPIIMSSILIGAQYFVQFFPVWAIYFLIAVHVIFLVISTYHAVFFPYISKVSNVLHLSVLMTTAIMDILRIVSIFSTFPTGVIQYITLTFIVLSIIGSSLIFYFVTKSFKKKLMYNQFCNANDDHGSAEHVTLSDEEKSERFVSLNLINHRLKTIFYLHLGIEYMCDLFIDFTLIKWIGQSQPQTDILLDLVKFLILFPGEYRLTNVIVSSSLQKRNLSLAHRNLLFQVFRIKILRQSSSSIQSSQKLAEMRNLNKSCESEILSFYSRSEVTLGLLIHINSLLSHTHSMWEEALKSFPNSPIHREEHIHYLVECETNFDSAIIQAHRKELIETGVNFSIDHCFRSLVGTYPLYLKRKVLDLKGNFMKSSMRKGSQSQNSNSNNSNQFSFTSTSDMDQKMEEEIGKTIMKQSKIRLALQTATQGKKANNSNKLTNFNRAALLISVVMFTVLFAVFFTYFDGRYSATERSMQCNKCRINFDISSFCLLMSWANTTSTKRIEFQAADEAKWFESESRDSGYLDPNENYSKNAIISNVNSQVAYSGFLSDFAALARSGVNIFPMTTQLMQDIVPQTFCIRGQPVATSMSNLRTTIVYSMMFQVMLASENAGFDDWFKNNNYFCTIFSTMDAISNAFIDLRQLLVDDQIRAAKSVKGLLNILSFALPCCFVVILFIPYFVLTMLFNHEIHRFISLIMSVDSNHKNDAVLPLMRNDNDMIAETQNAEEQPPVATIVVVYLILIFVLSCGLTGLLIGIMLSVSSLNTKFEYIGIWSYKASSRSPLVVEALKSLYLSIFLQTEASNISTSSAELQKGKLMITKIEKFRDMLIQGDNEAPSVLGFDETITRMMIQSSCTPSGDDVILHDMYVCGSVNQLVIFFKDLFNSASANMKKFNGKINHESTLNLYHMTLYHLVPRLMELDDQFTKLAINFQKSYKDNLIIMFICALVVSAILFLVGIAFTNILDGAFNAALVLLRRISPVGIIAKPKLVKYLLEISSEEKNSAMNISRSVFHNSQDGIFCIGLLGTIEVVNPAVSSILGYTPDQMLGQSITNIMDETDASTVKSQLQLMADRQSAPVYESHIVCVTDNDLKIECSLTILGITETNGEISSFVAVIRDEHELVTQQEEAERAKAQSENLLFQILPRGIVVRLNQGEKDISFSVPSSTICFVDIVKFSDYTVSMKPQEIMGTLSSLFGAYDEILTKYALLLKIKLIGDVYMCAGGLFSPDEQPSSHAEQMIRFGLDALQQLEDTNIKMNTLLNVRIGVNTGGPLIAGVLGTDKPVFDIIGDPINIASRLQSTDIPGKIQISQATYDLIKEMDFLIDQRGEVFLKGKGQSMAYLVSPHINTFQLSNCELSDSQSKNGRDSLSALPNAASPPQ